MGGCVALPSFGSRDRWDDRLVELWQGAAIPCGTLRQILVFLWTALMIGWRPTWGGVFKKKNFLGCHNQTFRAVVKPSYSHGNVLLLSFPGVGIILSLVERGTQKVEDNGER